MAQNMGLTLAGLGRFADALDWYDAAVAAAPDDLDAIYNRHRVAHP